MTFATENTSMGISNRKDEQNFITPWEARIFAIVSMLVQDDKFHWDEFKNQLIDELKSFDERDDIRDASIGTPYYRAWLKAAETLFNCKDICEYAELETKLYSLSDPHAAGKHSPTGKAAIPIFEE